MMAPTTPRAEESAAAADAADWPLAVEVMISDWSGGGGGGEGGGSEGGGKGGG